MATYSQWAKNSQLRPVAWVCGPEPSLVRRVLAAYREVIPAGSQFMLWAADGSDREAWDVLLDDGLAEFPRLVLVYNAERLKDFAPLPGLLAAADAGRRAVFVSAEEDFARCEQDGKKALAPHLAAIQGSRRGQLIRCCAPARAEARTALVASWWPGSGLVHAHRVLELCGGDLTAAAQACDKAVRAGLAPDERSAAVVCAAEPGTSFADPLITGDRAGAMAAARQAGHAETGAGIGVLVSRLTALAAIGEALRAGTPPAELPGRTRVDRFLLRRLSPYAAAYNPGRVSRCRELLAMAEHYWRAGAQCGVAESVIALW